MTWPILSYFLAGHFALFFSEQKLGSGQGRSRAECSLLQQLVVSWRELCVIDESWSNTLLFFVFNFTVLFLNLRVHLPAALHLVIIFLLSRWMNHEQTGFSSFWLRVCSSVIKFHLHLLQDWEFNWFYSVCLNSLPHRFIFYHVRNLFTKRPCKIQWWALITSFARDVPPLAKQ